MKAHFAKYATSYLIGGMFLLLQVLIAFNGQAVHLTPAMRSAMTRFDWAVFYVRVGVHCLPVMIAFLNQSVARDRAAAPPPPAAG